MSIIETIRAEVERRMKVMLGVEGLVTGVADNMRYQDYKSLLSFLSTLEESERPEPYNPVYDEAYLNEKIKKATESWKGVDVDAMLAECRGYDEEKSEKPMNQDGLEEELDKWRHDHFHGKRDDHFSGEYLERTSQLDLARHFAQWGAEHLTDARKMKGGSSEIPNDLEEAAEEYADKHGFRVPYDGSDNFYDDVDVKASKEGFIAGAKWQKEQMMKEAVEGEVCIPNVWVEHKEGKELVVRAEISKGLGFKFGDKVRVIVLPKECEK